MTMPDRADIVFRNADVVDGTGAARRVADVAVTDDRIVAMGTLARTKGATEIDAKGRVLAPGFIDVHTHDDYVLLAKPEMTPKLSQGVTTVVVGNCGVSLAPLATASRPPAPLDLVAGDAGWTYPDFRSYFAALDSAPPAINGAALVGHSSLRVGVMDRTDRPAQGAEIARMRAMLEEGLESGAIGFSTGLAYRTAAAAPTEEVIEISRALTRHGALYVTHMRNEGDGVLDSIDETLAIG
ncbi:MAG: amidohydrolase family protein, partial [Alphaproteobacteria bacterium]|nr:amidohydrolase family protein [Alphaproteobacteria bacterium]